MARKVTNPGVGRGHGSRSYTTRLCARCGAAFSAARSDALRCKTCRSRERDARHHRVINPGIGQGFGVKVKKPHICIACNAEFEAVRSDALRCKKCSNLRKSRSFDQRHRTDSCPDCGAPKGTRSRYCQRCSPKHSAEQRRRRGSANHMWKGGRIRTAQGYVRVLNPNPPPRYIGEHVVVWEAANGLLPKGWHIHHLNGIRDDNRPENLQAMSRHLHQGLHVGDHFKEQIRVLEARIRELEDK